MKKYLTNTLLCSNYIGEYCEQNVSLYRNMASSQVWNVLHEFNYIPIINNFNFGSLFYLTPISRLMQLIIQPHNI